MILNFLKVIFSDFIKLFVSFSILIILTKSLSTNDFGIFGTIISYASLLSLLGLNTSNNKVLINLINDEKNFSLKIFNKVLLIRLFTFILTIIIFLVVNFLFQLNLEEYYLIISIIILSLIIWDLSESIFYANLNFNKPVFFSILFSFIWLIAAFVFSTKVSFYILLIIYSLIYLIRAFSIFFISKKFISNKVENSNLKISDILKLSLPYLLMRILAGIIEHSPVILLGIFISQTEVAFYHLGNRLTIPFILIFGAILRTLYPYMSKFFVKNKENLSLYISKFYAPIFLLIAFSIFIISISSNFWIPLIFGKEYFSVIEIFKFLSWIILFFSFDLVMSNILSTYNLQKKLGLITLIDFIIVLPFIYIGSMYDSEYLSFLKLISYFITFNFHLLVLNRLVNLKIFNLKFIFSYFVVISLIILSFTDFSNTIKLLAFSLCILLSILVFLSEIKITVELFNAKNTV